MELDEPWRRIVAWLTVNAPTSAAGVRPPAGPSALDAARAFYPRPWPRDLVRLYELCDGTTGPGQDEVELLPLTPVVPLESLRPWHEMNLEVAAEFASEEERAEQEASPAGTDIDSYLPSFVPFGQDGMGDGFFVDLRGGPGSGGVGTWRHADVSTGGDWPSLTIMFDDVATALETGGVFDGWVPDVQDGRFRWEPRG